MREIVNKLQENRQLERAKSIMESNGYKVSKKSKEDLKESKKVNEAEDPNPELQDSISHKLAGALHDFGLNVDDAPQTVTDPFDELVYQSAKVIENSSVKESKESKEDIKESNLNESALDKLWDLYDSSPAIADAIEKIADELGIGTDSSPTEEEARQILDAYSGEGNSLKVRDVNDMIEEIMEAVEGLEFVQSTRTFADAGLMTDNKGFIIKAKDGKSYQFSLLGSH